MHIINWFIEKITNAVQAYRDNRSRKQIEKWYSANEVTDEQLRLDHKQMMAEYEQQCKEEDERQAREQKELQAEILEDQRFERQVREWEAQERESDMRRCSICSEFTENCICGDFGPDEEVSETTLINRECAAVDLDEPVSPEIEHANTPCSKCGLLPEFCQCQYEE